MGLTPDTDNELFDFSFAECETPPYYFDIDKLKEYADAKGTPMSQLTEDEKLHFIFLKEKPDVPIDKRLYYYYLTSAKEPVLQKNMKYGYDIKKLKAYANETGIPIDNLTMEEKLQFLFYHDAPEKPIDRSEYKQYMDQQCRQYAETDIDSAIYVAEHPVQETDN